jgi:hypothetical protein
MPFLISRYFGLRVMGAIFGCAFTSHVVGLAVGGYLLGVGFDATGSYRTPLLAGMAILTAALAAALCLGPYRTGSPAAPVL